MLQEVNIRKLRNRLLSFQNDGENANLNGPIVRKKQ